MKCVLRPKAMNSRAGRDSRLPDRANNFGSVVAQYNSVGQIAVMGLLSVGGREREWKVVIWRQRNALSS